MQAASCGCELVPADGVLAPGIARRSGRRAAMHVHQRERERRVAAGERLQVQVGAPPRSACGSGRRRSRVPGDSGSQCSCWCGADADGLAPQTTMQRGVARRARVETRHRAAVDVAERDVAGLVADRVRDRPRWRRAGRRSAGGNVLPISAAGARVVRVQDRVGAGPTDRASRSAISRERLVPRDGLEPARALRARRAAAASSAAPPGSSKHAVVADRALAAELAAADGWSGIAADVADRAVAAHE